MRSRARWIVCAALFVAAPALAQQAPPPSDADVREAQERHDKDIAGETAYAKALFGDATPEKAHFACYVRVYDAAHLKAHPVQKVTDIRIIVSARPLTAALKKGTADEPAEETLWRWRYSVHSILRNGAVRDRATTTPCFPGLDFDGSLHMRCNAACDTGDEIRPKDDGRAITFGIANEDLADKKFDPHDDKAKPVDDFYFRLAQAPMAQCAFKP